MYEMQPDTQNQNMLHASYHVYICQKQHFPETCFIFQVTPRGVQLHLGSHKQPHLQDTLVMSNLGYFQLKSAPGAWTLQLAPGRSRDLYHIQSSTGTIGGSVQTEALAEVSSGSLRVLTLLRPGF